MSRMPNSRQATVAAEQKKQQILAQQKKTEELQKENSTTQSELLQKDVDQQSYYHLINLGEEKKTNKRKAEEEDAFGDRISNFSNNPNLNYLNSSISQLNQSRSIQKRMKMDILQRMEEKKNRGRYIKEVQEVPTHMPIKKIQYYPRPYLKTDASNSTSQSRTSTNSVRMSCAGNYRTRIPHEELVQKCKEEPVIKNAEELKKWIEDTTVVVEDKKEEKMSDRLPDSDSEEEDVESSYEAVKKIYDVLFSKEEEKAKEVEVVKEDNDKKEDNIEKNE